MDNATRLGLDVHKQTIAVAVLRPGEQTPDERVIPNTPEALRALIGPHRSRSRLIACYEAGPTGYDTYRQLRALGVDCEVIAPTLIPRRAFRRTACGFDPRIRAWSIVAATCPPAPTPHASPTRPP